MGERGYHWAMVEVGRIPAMWRMGQERLRGPRLQIEVGSEEVVFVKGGLRRVVEIGKVKDLWKTLTNDMEFNDETAGEVLELIAAKTTIASGEVF